MYNRAINPHSSRPCPHARRGVLALLAAIALSLLALVPAVAEAETAADEANSGVVNINQADTAGLMLLPRVGPALAGRIVEHRESNGPFKTPEDLILVRGIGEKTFALMEPHVVVEGKTTLRDKVRATRTGDA